DIFEVKSGHIVRRGRITTSWNPGRQVLKAKYVNRDFQRTVRVTARGAEAVYANGRISFDIVLEPGATWHCCVLYELHNGVEYFPAPDVCVQHHAESELAQTLEDWKARVAKIRTSNEEFYRFYTQAIEDMAALRLPMAETDHMEFMPAAGLPWFVAPFGRDSLIVSLQNFFIYPEFARATLKVLGRFQAREDDPYRDAEPGKIMHELRYGELAHFKKIPHTPYYGTADATILWLITLHAAWHSTGDRSLLEQHLDTAERCLHWIEHHGDRDGDGFQEYETRSPVGYKNQGWKDAGDAIVYPDGSQVKTPIALCELQGYVHLAWLRMAEVYDDLNKPEQARALRQKAARLYERFNEVFWDDAAGFYALALDGDKKKVMTIASNPGHLLLAGIVPPDRARAVADRLFQDDMWTQWGIRTLSSKNPAYDPYEYQRGSIWPHDNGIIALGFKRYGFHREANRVARAISGAASHFLSNQVPELYAGINSPFPVQYLGANVPQAWAAGSAFMMLRAILGFLPKAPEGKLYVDPVLPEWLSDLTIYDLRLGDRKFDIRFWREEGDSHFEVLKGEPSAVVRGSPIPWGA
ncbi:MAG: hypothetical protein JO212_14890, partial [Acetobacteraceae bacterium]|nr:hypothetical protein [Acetobacteraceae bacterium]